MSLTTTAAETGSVNHSEPLLGTDKGTARKHTYPVALLACLNALQFGYDTAIMSAAAPLIPFIRKPLISSSSSLSGSAEEAPIDSLLQGLVVSSVVGGAMITALCSGSIADRLGRIRSMLFTEVLFLLGSALCAVAPWLWLLIAGRVILGLAVGAASVVVPLYIVEVSPAVIRGEVAVLNQLCICLGILFAYALGTAFSYIQAPYHWRTMVGAPALLPLLHMFAMAVWPTARTESPRWLLLVGRSEDARRSLEQLRHTAAVDAEFRELEAESSAQGSSKSKPGLGTQLKALLHPARPIILATGIMFWQQITGINAVLYYLQTFLQNAGLSKEIAGYGSIVVGAVNVLMTIVSIFLIERLGRKVLLLISVAGMALCLGAIAVVDLAVRVATISGYASVAATVLFVVSFAVGMGACPWAVVNELFVTDRRAMAVSLSLATNWTINLIVSLLFPVLVSIVQMGWVFVGFAALAVCAFIFLLTLLPETKGRTPEELMALM